MVKRMHSTVNHIKYILDDITHFSSVSGIALGYRLVDQRFESQHGLGIFLFTMSRKALGPTQPPI
jgi:uncharacterized protein YjaZ